MSLKKEDLNQETAPNFNKEEKKESPEKIKTPDENKEKRNDRSKSPPKSVRIAEGFDSTTKSESSPSRRRINLANFDPQDQNRKINSPRSKEALLQLGFDQKDLYARDYKKLEQAAASVSEAKALFEQQEEARKHKCELAIEQRSDIMKKMGEDPNYAGSMISYSTTNTMGKSSNMSSCFMSRKKKKDYMMEMVDEKILDNEKIMERKSEAMEKKYVMQMLETEQIRQDMENKAEERKVKQLLKEQKFREELEQKKLESLERQRLADEFRRARELSAERKLEERRGSLVAKQEEKAYFLEIYKKKRAAELKEKLEQKQQEAQARLKTTLEQNEKLLQDRIAKDLFMQEKDKLRKEQDRIKRREDREIREENTRKKEEFIQVKIEQAIAVEEKRKDKIREKMEHAELTKMRLDQEKAVRIEQQREEAQQKELRTKAIIVQAETRLKEKLSIFEQKEREANERLQQQTEKNKAQREEDLIGGRIDKLKKEDAIKTILRLQQYHNDMTNKRLKEDDERVAEQKAMKYFLIEERKDKRAQAELRRQKLKEMIEKVSHTGRIPPQVQAMLEEKKTMTLNKSQSSADLEGTRSLQRNRSQEL